LAFQNDFGEDELKSISNKFSNQFITNVT
jgi:hypothetical protein